MFKAAIHENTTDAELADTVHWPSEEEPIDIPGVPTAAQSIGDAPKFPVEKFALKLTLRMKHVALVCPLNVPKDQPADTWLPKQSGVMAIDELHTPVRPATNEVLYLLQSVQKVPFVTPENEIDPLVASLEQIVGHAVVPPGNTGINNPTGTSPPNSQSAKSKCHGATQNSSPASSQKRRIWTR